MFEIGLDISSNKISAVECFKTNKSIFIKNADSVVLLKGDEIITLYINEIYYD
jgi:hypothetical protein